MKRLLTLLTVALAAWNASADPIDAGRARQIAVDFLAQDTGLTLVKQAQRNAAKARRLSAAVAATSPYYIYSRGAGQGFVIVAGDDCMPAILGYTDSGDFDEATVPPALADMLAVWTQTVEDAQLNGLNAPQQEARRRAAADRDNIAPLMSSHWHQSSPYNDRCPYITGTSNRALTGCVATAASQILYYWRRDLPSTLQGTTPTYGYGDAPVTESIPKGTELRWDLMKDSYSGSESSTVKNAVAEFVFATGAATWLTYGSSTSGNIEKIPATYSGYYGMKGGNVHYRNSYSQETWVQLLYDELLAGRPVMYTGVHPDNGGHAVVVHGYQKSKDLFYFNFGWGAGNGYDGYYTVDTETGMNGFYDYQSALIGAMPKEWNMTATLAAKGTVYAQRTNQFKVTVENNSTLAQSGFYLFAGTSNKKPTSLTSAKSSDVETVVPTGESATFTLTCKPTSTKTWYITLTDANLTVLQQIEVVPEVAPAQLSLSTIYANASADTDTLDGQAYQKFYNDKALVTAIVRNDGTTDYEGTGKLDIYVLDEATGEWTLNGSRSLTNVAIAAGTSEELVFSVTNIAACPIEAGRRYYAELGNPWKNTVSSDTVDTSNSYPARAYFIVTGENDLAVSSFADDGTLSFTGHWDRSAFESIVKRSAYKAATAYDVTAVEAFPGDVDNSIFPLPNALVYASEHVIGSSPNVIYGDICPVLELQAGYGFLPKSAFYAWNASLTIGTATARWYLVTVPFPAYVPDGMIARRIDSHKSTGITTSTVTDVDELVPGHTYMVMASSRNNMKLYADPEWESFYVLDGPVANPDTAVVGTFAATTTPAGAQLLNDDEKQYFVPVAEGTEVEGLRGYFCDPKLTKTFRAYPSLLLDPAYVTLANAIQQAYDVLDEYRNSAGVAAYNAYADSIHAAEYEFSHRAETELTTAKLITNYAEHLLALGEDYKVARPSEGPNPDINGDGSFDISDVTLLIECYLKSGTDSDVTTYDLDGDGQFTVADITILITMYLEL